MAISLGGAVAPAATPFAIDANSPNFKRFNVTALDADTGPTTFNHGLSVASGDTPVALIVPAFAGATTVINSGWGVTVTQTQVLLSKGNLAGSATAQTPAAVLYMWNVWSGIR